MRTIVGLSLGCSAFDATVRTTGDTRMLHLPREQAWTARPIWIDAARASLVVYNPRGGAVTTRLAVQDGVTGEALLGAVATNETRGLVEHPIERACPSGVWCRLEATATAARRAVEMGAEVRPCEAAVGTPPLHRLRVDEGVRRSGRFCAPSGGMRAALVDEWGDGWGDGGRMVCVDAQRRTVLNASVNSRCAIHAWACPRPVPDDCTTDH